MAKIIKWSWSVVQIARRTGRKITEAALYEKQQSTDGSVFFICPDHPLGPRIMRAWPK